MPAAGQEGQAPTKQQLLGERDDLVLFLWVEQGHHRHRRKRSS